jgi:periplasmic divalent cation tolerance protein
MMKVALRVVLVTAPSAEVGEKIARTVVEERLVACVNVLAGVTSIYRWQGRVEQASEVLLVMKTVQDRLATLTSRVKELHPYSVPEVLALPVDAALPAYAEWIAEETGRVVV